VAVSVSCSSADETTAPGSLITEPGTYKSPDGDSEVWIGETTDGLEYRFGPGAADRTDYMGPAEPLSAKSCWFMAWDPQGRLWAFDPEDKSVHTWQ
jgi:hypothetical protein